MSNDASHVDSADTRSGDAVDGVEALAARERSVRDAANERDRADLLAFRRRAVEVQETAVDARQDAALDRVNSEADRQDAGSDRAAAKRDRRLD